MRDEIKTFAEQMEWVMSENDISKGDSWKTCDLKFLEEKLKEEITEYFEDGITHELIDIANMAMMLWNRKKELP